MNQEIQTVYSQQFRESSVKMALDSDQPLAQIARALGINCTLLHTWINSCMHSIEPSKSRQTDNYLDDELKRLKEENSLLIKENRVLIEERDLLNLLCKKAMMKYRILINNSNL